MLIKLAELKADLTKRTVNQQIAQKLAGMIRSGLLRVGDELPSERELASTLDVSRETVRSAIQSLAAVGMVEVSQGARTRVARADRWPHFSDGEGSADIGRYSARTVYAARRLIELAVVRDAARHIGAADLERLRRLLEAQRDMLHDPVRFAISDQEFHQLIYRAGGNELLAYFLGEIYRYALHYRRQALLVPGAVERSWRDHSEVLASLEKHDPDAAAAMMERHLTRVHRTTLTAMKSARRTQ